MYSMGITIFNPSTVSPGRQLIVYIFVFISGNHDYYLGDIENLYKHLEETGIKVLSNKSVKICREADDKEESCFYLVGTEDISQGQGLITKQRYVPS